MNYQHPIPLKLLLSMGLNFFAQQPFTALMPVESLIFYLHCKQWNILCLSLLQHKGGAALPVKPFRLSPDTCQAPSEFEIMFLMDGIRYQYGFSATSEQIHEEWLFAYPKNRAQSWFTRVWVPNKKHFEWKLGENLAGEKQHKHLWQNSTRDNALFLSTAVQLNSKQLHPIFDWFKHKLHSPNISRGEYSFSTTLCENDQKSKVMNFLNAADINIDDIQIETSPFNPNELPTKVPATLKQMVIENMKERKVSDIKIIRKDNQGKFGCI